MKYLIDLHHGFGDVLHMVPAMRAIKNNDTNAEIAIIMSTQANTDIYRTQSVANDYILLKLKELLKYRLKRGINTFDYGIIAPCIMNQRKSEFLLKFLGCRKIIKEDVTVQAERKHRVDKNIALVEKLGIKTEDPYPRMFMPRTEKEFARKEFNKFKNTDEFSKLYIALCLGGNFETLKKGKQKIKLDIKRWPAEYYHQLINMLLKRYPGVNLLLIGSKEDAVGFWNFKGVDRVNASDVYDYMGKTSMLQSGALIELCDFAVGNDTGMIHFAAALGRPTMAIFCSTDPQKIGAYAKNAVYIEEYLPCKYCYLSEATFTCKDRKCLSQIKPDRVLNEITTMVNSLILED